jgi:hypothetical protein
MPLASNAIEAAIRETDRLRSILKKSKSVQVRSVDERGLAKATASAWFFNHRAAVESSGTTDNLESVDSCYRAILDASDRHGARSRYLSTLATLKQSLIRLRTDTISTKPSTVATSDLAPDFSPLIADTEMQEILISRWNECVLCLGAGAALAATVMMGGLLEALLLARINREANKAAIFTAKSAPKNAKTATTKPLGDWMLNDFIQVLAELKWITVSATAVSAVLRDYRNYIHPQKQLSHNLHLKPEDAALFWEVAKNITRQVISSAP